MDSTAATERTAAQPGDTGTPPVGVLVMAYGTPSTPEGIEEYYTHIRHGRPPTPEQLADLQRRYEAIGGVFHLRERTEEQLGALSDQLERIAARSGGGQRFVVRLGQKHEAPFVEDGAAQLLAAGAELIVGLVLAPHYSAASVGQYHERARAVLAGRAEYRAIEDWSQEPAFIATTAAAVAERLAALPPATRVVFTAHSLPLRVLEGDPYVERLTASAQAIAQVAGLHDWGIGWQSAGRTPEPWIGPDILGIITTTAAEGERQGLLVVPQGFTSDHLEVLYDLDIEARALAEQHGLAFARTAMINAAPAVMGALAELVARTAGGEVPEPR